jgi:hypothetical protein
MMKLLSAVFVDRNIVSSVLLVYGPMAKMEIFRRSIAGEFGIGNETKED